MKLVLPFAALLLTGIATATATATAAIAAPDYTLVCNSSKLTAGERHECRVKMTAAATEAEQFEIFRVYDAKIASLALKR